MAEIYDGKNDPEFSRGIIDQDEMRVRDLGNGKQAAYRFLHGYFQGTNVKFSFCFPEKETYQGRFYQYLSPFPGPDEELASLPVTGPDDKIGFCIKNGAYYVESNMGSKERFGQTSDETISYRSCAAVAEFSRVKAKEIYGYDHRPYGYVYGGSGGGYRTIACIENTNAFDGAVPYVIGSPYAIPSCQTTRAYAERVLRDKIKAIADIMDAGGSGDPYAILNDMEKDALEEVTAFGYPLKSWFASIGMDDGSLTVIMPLIKQMDPLYFEDYWTKEGYLGNDPSGSAVKDRIKYETFVSHVFIPLQEEAKVDKDRDAGKKEQKIDTRNGVDNAWKKMILSSGNIGEPFLELEQGIGKENPYIQGLVCEIQTGEMTGRKLLVSRIDGTRIFFKDGYGMDHILETLKGVKCGDKISLDNSDYIAVQTYHRHQVPTPDFTAWDRYRDKDGNPALPQRNLLLGPLISSNGTGSRQTGKINGKVIICASLMDEQAYPWQADWYRRKINSVSGKKEDADCRIWYFDHTLHGDETKTTNELYVTSYVGGLKQALLDLAQWVENGEEPLPSSAYQVQAGQIAAPENAVERGGIQPVVKVFANGEKCVHVKAGEQVLFTAEAEVPDKAGILTYVEWSFEGEEAFSYKGDFTLSDGGCRGKAECHYTYVKSGTYFTVVRVMSQRDGDKEDLYTQVRNIDRVRIVVE